MRTQKARACAELREGEREVERKLRLVVAAVVGGHPLWIGDPCLAEQQPRRTVAVGDRAPVAEDVVRFGAVGVVYRRQPEPALHGVVAGQRWVVP
jgi:hypothetical protein